MLWENAIDRVPTDWLAQNYERAIACHAKLKDKMWVLKGGSAADWAWGEKPPAVPNQSMPWVRPEIGDFALRVCAFDQNPKFMAEQFAKRRQSWRRHLSYGTGFRPGQMTDNTKTGE
jgi:hypothetical protein